MAVKPLWALGQATVDSNGRAVVQLRPSGAWESWNVVLIAVNIPGETDGECRVYEGSEVPSNQIDWTPIGADDASDIMPGTLIVSPGEFLTVVWALATPGATAYVRVRYLPIYDPNYGI